MPLSIDALKTAQVDTSDNRYLKPLWNAVNAYNANGKMTDFAAKSKGFEQFRKTGKTPKQLEDPKEQVRLQRAEALQDIMFNAASFLTCKPPNPDKAKRHPRWDAMTQLMGAVNDEAASIGVKLVDSPTDFRNVAGDKPSVWLEVVDPRHRSFGALSKEYKAWSQDPNAEKSKQSFWKYIGDKLSDEVVLYDLGAKTLVEKNLRGRYAEIQGHAVSTRGHETIQTNGKSNKGWCVFAVTADGQLHIGDHSNEDGEQVRHTSLTGGEPILAAGEICMAEGKIVAISNLTGHYKLGATQFFNWIVTSPLITPDVVVKTRFGVTQTVVSGNEKKPGSQKTTIKSDHVIGATTVQMISDWMNKGRPAGEYPFPEDQQKLARGLRFAGLDDLRDTEFNPDDGDMNVDLPAPKLPTTSDAET